METGNKILLVRVPADGTAVGRELRDYILESLARGVLVLTEDTTCEVMELPALGGVEVLPKPATLEAPGLIDLSGCSGSEEEEPPPVEVAGGRNKEEKQAILARLREYRRAHGLGCWNAVASEAGGGVTPELIRDMLLGKESPPIADWRRIAKALDALEPC